MHPHMADHHEQAPRDSDGPRGSVVASFPFFDRDTPKRAAPPPPRRRLHAKQTMTSGSSLELLGSTEVPEPRTPPELFDAAGSPPKKAAPRTPPKKAGAPSKAAAPQSHAEGAAAPQSHAEGWEWATADME